MSLSAHNVREVALTLVAPLVGDRPVLMAGAAEQSRSMAQFFHETGATVASVTLASIPVATQTRFAFYESSLAGTSDELRHQLDVLDPRKNVLVYAGSFITVTEIDERRVIGGRSLAHITAERKDRQQHLTGLKADAVVVREGMVRLTGPAVVEGVPRVGVAMTTSHTYLVPPQAKKEQIGALATRLRQDCDEVLIRDFRVGAPCTFYGFVTHEWCLGFGPVETLVYWEPATWRIHAPGIRRPLCIDQADVDEARFMVRSVGERLNREVGYVGAFGADGIMHDGRYVIYEINPRVCSGFVLLDAMTTQTVPLSAVDLVLREVGRSAATDLCSPLSDLASSVRDCPAEGFLWFESNRPLVGPKVVGEEMARYLPLASGLVEISHLREWQA